MNTDIIAQIPPSQAPTRQEREKECAGCGIIQPMTGLYCPTCRASGAGCGIAPAGPKKIVLPKPSKRETYAACCVRLGAQGRLNGVTARPVLGVAFAHELTWHVPSQDGPGGYTVTWHTASNTWSCGCEAHAGNRLCAHVALCRTWATECPTCGGTAVVYAAPHPADRRTYQGAVRCLTPGCLLADLTAEEAEALQEAHLGVHTLPILGLLLVVVRRLDSVADRAVA